MTGKQVIKNAHDIPEKENAGLQTDWEENKASQGE